MKFNIKAKMALLMLIIVITVGVVGVMSINGMNELKDVSLKTQEEEIRDNFDKNIKEQVENAISLVEAVYEKSQAGEYTMDEAKKIAADLLRELRYGDDGYFWTDTYDGDNVVLLGNETEGTNRIETKDSTGFQMVKEIIRIGQEADGGYVNFTFPKPNTTEPLPKRSYSKAFEPFEWVIGTGNYTDFIDTYVAEQKIATEKNISASITKMIIIVGICFLISLLLSFYIAFSILVPLKKFIKITDNLAKGNLDTEVNIKSNDEIGQLAVSMQSLVDRLKTYMVYINEISDLLKELGNGNLNLSFQQTYDGDFGIIKDALLNTSNMLNDTLSEFNNAANQVASGSGQVSIGAQSLSQSSTEQASSIQELSATISDISSQIKQSTDHASKAKQITMQTNETVERGQQQMRDMVDAMNEINNTSNEIGKIIKSIDDIAFQTNILALNAAVEAARAGSAGKGFAVVADEVRNLASKSANSASSTSALIESALVAINKGTEIVAETAKALDEIVLSSEESAEIIQQIADKSQEQENSIAQINIGFEQISNAVQMNSATAEESAAASEELSSQAQMLNELIGKFKLKEE